MKGAFAVKADNWILPNQMEIQKLKAFQFHPENSLETKIPDLVLYRLDRKFDLKSNDVQDLKWFFPQDKSGIEFDYMVLRKKGPPPFLI